MSFFVRARFDVRDEQREEFEKLACALRELAEAEPGTLVYRWFSAGAGRYLVLEEYADTAAAMAHQKRAAQLLARVGASAELAFAELHGEIGPGIREWVHEHPQATVYPEWTGDRTPTGSR
ncbi:antibiotic biosynthesis monooxygenase family protein [Streptomyces sp. NPDC001793]|uniref:putative quinol monooxygenase n=1 Tax=Streptomyces sp. NPDC001793 TaxID=3154657 RepID=UPI0033255326